MHAAIDDLLDASGGVGSRLALLGVVTRTELDNEIRRGNLVRIFPRAYARPWLADLVDTRDRAALACVGGFVAISHTSALRRWGLRVDDDVVHVTIPTGRGVRGVAGSLVVHHTSARLPCLLDRGVLTAAPEAAAVQAWVTSSQRRELVIETVRRGLASVSQLTSMIESAALLPRRGELLELVDLLDKGAESELEIWGHLHVFDIPGLRQGRQQLEVRAGGVRYRIDRAYEVERVAVELDGEAFHSSRSQRERDRRRDVALATQGWLTLRFSHRRLTTDPLGCQRELLAVLAARTPPAVP